MKTGFLAPALCAAVLLLPGCVSAPDPNLVRDSRVFMRYLDEGRYDEAEALARDLDRRSPVRHAQHNFTNAVRLARESGQDRIGVMEPPAYLTEIIEVNDAFSMNMEGPSDSATGLNQRGVQLYRAGDYSGAVAAFDAAEPALRAQISDLQGRSDMASPLMLSRLALPSTIANRALAKWRLGQLSAAHADVRKAFAERTALEASLNGHRNERDMLFRANARQKELSALISLESRLRNGGDSLALLSVLQNKSITLENQAQTLRQVRQNSQSDSPPGAQRKRELLDQLRRFTQQRADLANNPPRDPSQRAAHQQRLADLDWEIREVQEALHHRSDRSGAAAGSSDSLISQVRGSIPAGAALVEMVRYRAYDPRRASPWGTERYAAYVLTPSRPVAFVELGEASAMDALVGDFRRALADDLPTIKSLARRLDQALMRPLRAHIGSARQLYLVPDANLNLVPFAALIAENGQYLLERYTINHLSSGRDLLDQPRIAPRSPASIFADPLFALQGPSGAASGARSVDFTRVQFSQLPGTAEEAQALARLLPDAVTITGAAATETQVKAVAGPRVLHIATHGFFLDNPEGLDEAPRENPMLRSGLVFAGVSGLRSDQDDGVLTALEASALDLMGTRLVVLSACETGVGQVRSGEGVFGLRRAIAMAGAETLVMSLWQVEDEATRDLMVNYYQRLVDGVPRAEALRAAQLSLLRNRQTASPFFWAAFISSGQTGPL